MPDILGSHRLATDQLGLWSLRDLVLLDVVPGKQLCLELSFCLHVIKSELWVVFEVKP